MEKISTLVALERAYLLLLQMPDTALRLRNQETLCHVRDAIAQESGLPAQEVQESFESMAVQMKLAA